MVIIVRSLFSDFVTRIIRIISRFLAVHAAIQVARYICSMSFCLSVGYRVRTCQALGNCLGQMPDSQHRSIRYGGFLGNRCAPIIWGPNMWFVWCLLIFFGICLVFVGICLLL